MIKDHKKKAGFTLIEILIVVMVLGILAMIIVPQLQNSSKDAKEVALSANLSELRSAIQLYSFHHNYVLPGERNHVTGLPVTKLDEAMIAFEKQLLTYSNVNGISTDTKSAAYKYGPYLRGNALPVNPFNGKNDVTVDISEKDITERSSDGKTGWKIYYWTGIVMANDGGHDDL